QPRRTGYVVLRCSPGRLPVCLPCGMEFVALPWLRTADGWPQTLCRGHQRLAAGRSTAARAWQEAFLEEQPMTPKHISLSQRTFPHIRPQAETAATLFYTRLFTLDPSLRFLFTGNMQQQGAMLMRMLALAIDGLHHPDTLVAPLQALGQRHVGYGVCARDYDTVGAALLWTLEHALGAQWTEETGAAWRAAYTLLATAMQSASTRVVLPPAACAPV